MSNTNSPAKQLSVVKKPQFKQPNYKPLGNGSKYSKMEIMDLFNFFKQLDKDGNGKVHGGEIVNKKDLLKLPALTHLAFIRAVDQNGDGVLTFDELLKTLYPYASAKELQVMFSWAYPTKAPPAPEDPHFHPSEEQVWELRELFLLYDKNKSGGLDFKEVLDLTETAGYDPEEVERLFTEADVDNDKIISFEEFVQLMSVSYLP